MNKNHDQEKWWIRSYIYDSFHDSGSNMILSCMKNVLILVVTLEQYLWRGDFRTVSQHLDSKYVSRFYAKAAYIYFVIKVNMFPGLSCFKVQLLNYALLMQW